MHRVMLDDKGRGKRMELCGKNGQEGREVRGKRAAQKGRKEGKVEPRMSGGEEGERKGGKDG